MNAFRIFVSKKNDFDTVSEKLLKEINYNLHLNIKGIKLYSGYDIFDIEDSTKNIFVKKVLSDTVTDEVLTDVSLENKSFVAYKLMAGQFDVRSYNAIKCLNLLSTVSDELTLETFELIVFDEKLDEKTIKLIKNYLINPAEKCEKDLSVLEKPVIPEKDKILDIKDFKNYTEKEILEVKENLGINLDLETLLFIQKYYKENDYDCLSTELYLFDTYWSDHCRHTTFSTILENITFDDSENSKYVKSSYEKYIKRNEEINRNKPLTLMNLATFNAKYLEKKGKLSNVLQSEEVNACSFYHKINGEDYLVMFKNETHNHPTEIEPFGGAGTCLGGAIRDPLSGRSYVYQGIRITGAANPLEDIKDTLENKLPQSKICKDSAKGFSSYGNQIGMATTYVKEVYHESYKAKRLELGAVVGSVKAKDTKREMPIPSDIILLLGGRTGKDGIGGASGSSLSHEEDSLKTAMEQIQKGNPLEERKLQRLFRNGEFSILVKRCNDFGAGGVSVAIGELADGIEVWLDKIKLKTKNINYSQIAISESQERMAIVIDKNDLSKVKELCKSENVEVTEVGVVTNKNKVVMKYGDEIVASIDRAFLNTNGVTYYQNVLVKNDTYHNYDKQLYKKLNNYSQKGLIEIFDSSVSKSTILAPLGGKNQITTQLGSVSLINAENNSEEVSVVTHGFTPTVSEYSPYLAGIYAVVEAVCKNVALGGQIENMYISMQEYFPSLKKDDKKWGLVFQALLGAFEAMDNLEIGAIGGKDSMSGTYKDMDVISTIVAFAFTAFNKSKIISRELKEENSNIYLVKMKTDEFGYPLFDELKETFKNIDDIRKCIRSISTLEDGITNTLNNMSYGNDISYKLNTDIDLNTPYYGSFVIESKEEIVLDNFVKIGITKSCLSGEEIECKNEHLNGLYGVYPFTRNDIYAVDDYKKVADNKIYFTEKVKNPKVLIVCFSGTNSELDMEKCFRENGADTKILVINDKTNDTLKTSIDVFVEELLSSHILVFPGGFSFSDEPDGSGKFIANFLRNDVVKKAVHKHLEEKKLVLGICNGFQGLIKSGLLPYGKIKDLDENSPTLFYNDNFRHIAKSVKTYVASNKSPWLQDVDMDKTYTLPISHGEGKFVCTGEMLEYLKQNDLIATRYLEENPNGSTFNIEGIVSLDGLVLGKMAHNERSNNELFVNIDGEKDQNIFKSAVNYFNGGANTMNDNFLYEGKAKILYDNNDGTVTILYKDDATAFNGVKKDVLADKGIYNNKISSILYNYLEKNGINTHFVEKISDREQICRKVDIIPLEVIIRNVAAGSMAKRLGLEEGHKLAIPVFELSYKDDSLGDPLINSDHAIALSIVTQEELDYIKDTALKINELLSKLFLDKNILLVDFKIEFGKDENGNIVLADEISPDTCRFWEKDTKEKYDKDRFRRDLEDVMKGYTSILEILEV